MTSETEYWASLIVIMIGCLAVGFVAGVALMARQAIKEIDRICNGYGPNKFVECRPRKAAVPDAEVIGDA